MPVMSGGNVMDDALGTRYVAGAPSAGTDEVQTLTFGGTPTGGTFTLSHGGFSTNAINWTNNNATLLAAIQGGLQGLNSIGGGNATATAGTLTAGIGTVLITFIGSMAGQPQSLVSANGALLTGTNPTAAVARTTPGVAPTGRGAPRGAQLVDTTTGIVYANTSATATPTWTKIGTQT